MILNIILIIIIVALLIKIFAKSEKIDITENKELTELKLKLERMSYERFRVGDLVYAKDREGRHRWEFNKQYYILDFYNGKSCVYLSEKKDDKNRNEFTIGLGTENISLDPYPICYCCNKPL